MSTEQENVTRTGLADDIVANLLAHGMLRDGRAIDGGADNLDPITVIKARLVAVGLIPPEPQWTPGQRAWIAVKSSGHVDRVLGRRSVNNRGWWLPGIDHLYTDNEVTDVEPAVVLTAEDVQATAGRVATSLENSGYTTYISHLAAKAVVDEFAERGVDVR